MTRFLVLERGEGKGPDVVFLRDRFHFVAFLLPFVWLAAHRLYLFAIVAFLAQGGLFGLGRIEGFGFAAAALSILFGIAVALEGPRLVAWHLRRRGYREAAALHAQDLDEAELLYYGDEERPSAPLAEMGPAHAAPSPVRARELPAFGWRSGRTLLDVGRG